ncbi:MAG: GGDEF domain-containing protein [Lachnospiraceae bacterium]|nr:GGDEF domain-containing protein [Lachnospiraceae bacterium]
MVSSTLADYHKCIGDLEQAVKYYEQVEELYKTRTNELKQIQLSIHKNLKDADSSIEKLNRMVKESEETANVRFARYGGDEFLGLTYGLEDDQVADIARRICIRIRKADIPNRNNPNGKRVTLSVGIVNVAVTGDTDTIIQIANYADKAVYYSKNAGKNCIHLLDYGRTNVEGEDDPFVRIDF